MDSLGALSVFVRAAEARSFTDAGRHLGLSSSAIGKAVTDISKTTPAQNKALVLKAFELVPHSQV